MVSVYDLVCSAIESLENAKKAADDAKDMAHSEGDVKDEIYGIEGYIDDAISELEKAQKVIY